MTQISKEVLQKMIEKVVQKEIMNILPAMVGSAVKQVMVEMVQTSTVSSDTLLAEAKGYGNSGKMKNLVEASYGRSEEMRPYPDMDSRKALRERIAAGIGYDDGFGGMNVPNEITVDSMPSDPFGMGHGGAMVPVHPSQIPQSVRQVLNKDYSEIMDRVILKK